MKDQTIKQLNQLNLDFYQKIAFAFDQTRQRSWTGWEKISLQSTKLKLKVLDLGCGNGRFGQFLAEKHPQLKIDYWGVDQNSTLLSLAESKLKPLNLTLKLINLDLVSELISDQLFSELKSEKFDLIVLFGLIHHLPSFNLRQKLLVKLKDFLSPNGQIIITAWQFDCDQNLLARAVDPNVLGLDQAALESNDYILDWQRGTQAYRYAHLVTKAEMKKLAQAADLEIKASWEADGREENLNQYYKLTPVTNPSTI